MNKKITIPLVILIILLVIVAIVGISLWLCSKEDKTADQKIYRNEEYGFEIKYPKEWHYYEYQGEKIISTLSEIKYVKYYGTIEVEKLGESYGLIYITFPNYSQEELFEGRKKVTESLKNPVSGSASPYRIEEFIAEDIIIKGIKGSKIYYSGISFYRFKDGEESIDIIYFLPNRKKTGTIEFEGSFRGKNAKEYANKFDRMLSTFSFID